MTMRLIYFTSTAIALWFTAPTCRAKVITGLPCVRGYFSIDGSPAVLPLARTWATAYMQGCNLATITVAANGSNERGAQRICNAGSSVAVAALSRPFRSTEAEVISTSGFVFQCIQGTTSRKTIQVDVAIDGAAAIAAKRNGVAAKCIASLPGGGLTLDQIRWIYSKYILARLFNTGLSPSAVPNSDSNDGTHLWSELGGVDCPATEIKIAGPPKTSETFSLMVQNVLTDNANGETIALGRMFGYFSDPSDINVVNYLNAYSDAIGFFPTTYVNANNTRGLFVANLLGPRGFQEPTLKALGDGSYPLSRRLYMEVRSDDSTVLSVIRPFFAFAFSVNGSALVSSTGLVPLSALDRILMLTRLGAPGGVDVQSYLHTGCYALNSIDGSATLYPLVRALTDVYSSVCYSTIKVSANGDRVGVGRLCGNSSSGFASAYDFDVDVAMLDRPFTPQEATRTTSAIPDEFRCRVGRRNLEIRQVPIALDAITVSFSLGGISAKCVSSLRGGGLTVDQIRWIFSSYTTAQLVAKGWNPSSIPNSDGNDATHLWSELGGLDCPESEIKLAGPPITSEKYDFFLRAVLDDTNEAIATNRPSRYFNDPDDNGDELVQYLIANGDAIGLLRFADYANNLNGIVSAAVQNNVGSFVYPTTTSVNSGRYNPLSQNLFLNGFLSYFRFFSLVDIVRIALDNDFLVQAAGLIPFLEETKSTVRSVSLRPFPFLAGCFSESSTVEVLNKGVVSIKDLRIGDMVKNAYGEDDVVYSLGHHAPDVDVEFIRIHFYYNIVHALEITPEHMLLVNRQFIPALATRVGDYVTLVSKSDSSTTTAQVQRIKRVVRRGMYGPITMSGTIAINDIACSTYVDLQQDSGFLSIGGYKTPLSMQFLAHMFQASHRLICKASMAFCKAEMHNEQGLSTQLAAPVAAAEWFFQQNAFVMAAVFAPVAVSGVMIYLLELVVANKSLLLVALATWLFLFKRNNMIMKMHPTKLIR